MSEIKKILSKIFVLIVDILVFAFRIVRQIVLPNKKRKGNILSSVFIFFIGVIERLIPFEQGVFKMADIFKLKCFRQGVIITGALLFLLSLLEWTGDQHSINEPANYTEHFPQEIEKTIKVTVTRKTIFYSKIALLNKENSMFYINPFNNSITFSSPVRVCLFVKSLRI